VTLTSCKLAL